VALLPFEESGDLPVGVHRATLDEVLVRFGQGGLQRQLVTQRLVRIWEMARKTGKLSRFIIYGSYITTKFAPNDVDVILIMQDDFLLPECDETIAVIFHHMRTHDELGASVFWTTCSGVVGQTLEEFVAGWQTTRDHNKRGIVEIIWE
jgi:hypothetical protein